MGSLELSRKIQVSCKKATLPFRGLDRPLFLYYNVQTMNKQVKPIKYQSRLHPQEFYWSFPNWPSNFVEGVEFLAVVRQEPLHQTQQLHYVRKDSLVKVKNV